MDEAHRQIVLEQLSAVLASETFRGAERSCALFAYLVERALSGESERLKEYTVGVEALGRGASFDPRVDPIVRAEASRLRRRLEKYYGSEGRGARLAIAFAAAQPLHDRLTRGRIHPVGLWGGALFLVSIPGRIVVGQTDAWHAVMQWMLTL